MMALRVGVVSASAIAIAVTACSSTPAPSGSTTQPTQSPSSLPAGVDFPDTTGYAEGDHETFYGSGVQYGGYSFRTLDGQQCSSNSYPVVERTMIQCWGPRPDKGAGLWGVSADAQSPGVISRLPSSDGQPRREVPVLPADHVLTSKDAHLLCATNGRGTTACRVGEHGFVLTPDDTRLF